MSARLFPDWTPDDCPCEWEVGPNGDPIYCKKVAPECPLHGDGTRLTDDDDDDDD